MYVCSTGREPKIWRNLPGNFPNALAKKYAEAVEKRSPLEVREHIS
jgi:hypothetical protein